MAGLFGGGSSKGSSQAANQQFQLELMQLNQQQSQFNQTLQLQQQQASQNQQLTAEQQAQQAQQQQNQIYQASGGGYFGAGSSSSNSPSGSLIGNGTTRSAFLGS